MNLENAPYGQTTGIYMGNQLVRFGDDGVTLIGSGGGASMRYNCNGDQHLFGTTGSSKFAIRDYIFGSITSANLIQRTLMIDVLRTL